MITDKGCDLIPSACLQKQNVEECQHQQKYDLIYFFTCRRHQRGEELPNGIKTQNLEMLGLVKNFTSEAATTDLQ